MPISIRSNIPSLTAQQQLSSITDAVKESALRLASGLRINSASDDAASLALATSLHAKTLILDRARLNARDGISMLSVADAALQQLTSISQRLKELSLGASNEVLSNAQRQAADAEAQQLVKEYNRITESAVYNQIEVLRPELSTSLMLNDSTVDVSYAKALNQSTPSGTWTESTQTLESEHRTVLSVDFNNDGNVDLFVGASGVISEVHLGNGDGTFKAPISMSMTMYDVTAGDMDGDGTLDLILFSQLTPNIIVRKGLGDGTFAAGVSFSLSATGAGPVRVADVNQDGKLDVVTVQNDISLSVVSVFLGNGDGTLKARVTYGTGGSTGVQSLLVADFNNDGKLDVYHTTSLQGAYLALGNGNGTFSAPITSTNTWGIAYGDVNHDGKLDIIGPYNQQLGNGDGTFSFFGDLIPDGSGVVGPELTDLNHDGNLDALLVFSDNSVRPFFGNGDGTFYGGTTQNFSLPTQGFADFNNDGALDLYQWINNSGLRIALQGMQLTNGALAVNLTTVNSARSSVINVDNVITYLEETKGAVGAYLSRLQFADSHIQSAVIEHKNSVSRIVDIDVAQEVAEYQRLLIRQEAAQAVVAQANLNPQVVLKLLGEDLFFEDSSQSAESKSSG